MNYITIFILGILFWQLITFIATIVSNENEGVKVGSLVWYILINVFGIIIVKFFKIDFRIINYRILYKKWKKAIKKTNYDFGEFRKQNGKFWISSFNKLITSNEFKEHEKYLKEKR